MTKPMFDNYTDDLFARLAAAGLSHGMLARAGGFDPSQLSRWFNTPMQPSLRNVARLEHAFGKLMYAKRHGR